MQRYRLGELTKWKSGTKTLPKIEGTLAAEAAYLKVLRELLRALNKAVRTELLPAVEYELQEARRLTRDIDAAQMERIAQLGARLGLIANRAIEAVTGLEASRHTAKFLASAKRALEVDLSAVVKQNDLDDYLRTSATRSAGLIRGLTETTINRVQQTVTQAVLNGMPVKDLRKQIAADFGFADRRARLIARDQVAKLNSDLNRIRHTQAGITQYVWRTSHDERVRPRHRALDNIVYDYGKPTGAEQGLQPGQPIQCRCIAQAVVEFGDTPALPHGSQYQAIPVSAQPSTPRRTRTQPAPRRVSTPALPVDTPSVANTAALTPEQFKKKVAALQKKGELMLGSDPSTLDKFTAVTKGMDPETFLTRMGYQVDKAKRTLVSFDEDSMELGILGRIADGKGRGVGQLTRNFILNAKDDIVAVDHSLFKLEAGDTGKGLAKRVLAKQVRLYQELGVKEVRVHANIDVGGYAWAKYGFKPNKNSWDFIRNHVQRKHLGEMGTETALAAGKDSRAIWAISDLPDGLGKRILLESDWEGALDLMDPEAMRRFNAYVGQ